MEPSSSNIVNNQPNKIDYAKTLFDSIGFMSKHLGLWFFGFILALFPGGSISMLSQSISDTPERSIFSPDPKYDLYKGENSYRYLIESINRSLLNPGFWIGLIIGLVIIIVLGIIVWYLVSVSKVSIINAVKLKQANPQATVSIVQLWSSSHGFLKDIFIYDLILAILSFPVNLFFIIVTAVTTSVFLPLCCIIFPVFILWVIGLEVFKLIGLRFIVLRKRSFMQAITDTWNILIAEPVKIGVSWIVVFLMNSVIFVINSILAFIATIFLVAPLFLLFFSLFAAESGEMGGFFLLLIFSAILGLGGCCLLLINLFIKIPFVLTTEVYWTKIVDKLIER